MFWRNKRAEDDLFYYEANDRRESFRVCSSENEPISFQIGRKKIEVINISAGGVSFKNSKFSEHDTYKIVLDLPEQGITVPAEIEIIDIDKQDICHCRFKEIKENHEETIHQYVLARQK